MRAALHQFRGAVSFFWGGDHAGRGGEPRSEGVAHSGRLEDPVSGPHLHRKDPHSINRGLRRPSIGPHSHANGAECTEPMAQHAAMPRHTSCGGEGVTVPGLGRKTTQGDPRSTSHSCGRPSTGPHAHTHTHTRQHAPAPRPSRHR